MMDEPLDLQAQLDAANAENARLRLAVAVRPAVQTVDVPVNTKRVVIPKVFPGGFGYVGQRDSLSNAQVDYLQSCWDKLTVDAKVHHLLNSEQFIEQTVPNAPHVMAA